MFSWWGLSKETDPERCKARLAVLQAFVSDLQELFREASARQTDAVARANEKLANVAARVATARDPNEIMSLQADIGRWIVEVSVVNARAWADLTEKGHDCCHQAFTGMAAATNSGEQPTVQAAAS